MQTIDVLAVNTESINCSNIPSALEGLNIVVTGKVYGMSRKDMESYIYSRGATFQKAVTKHTDMLVVGEKPGAVKLRDAKTYSVPTCSGDEFFMRYGK